MTNPTDYTSYRNTCPTLTRPTDFFSFWEQTLAALGKIDIDCHISQTRQHTPGLTEEWLTFNSLHNIPLTAYCLRWNDDTPRPLVVYTHGYAGQCEVMLDWARQGINILGVDLRGMGRSVNPSLSLSPHGYVLTGIESPQQSILRDVVCDFIRAYEVARDVLDINTSRIIFHGHSFGGAISLMAASISHLPDLLVSGVPTLGWAEGRQRLVKRGSGLEIIRYLQRYPERGPATLQTLSYFDTMNFADRVRCPALVGIGQQDEIVPAATVYAITNHMQCPLEIRELPVSHSDQPAESLWQQFEAEWLQLANKGIPSSFGQAKHRFKRIA